MFHEAGHAVAMKHYGIPTGPMTFIPFMGAVIVMKDRPRNVYEEAVVAIGAMRIQASLPNRLNPHEFRCGSQYLVEGCAHIEIHDRPSSRRFNRCPWADLYTGQWC